MTKAALLATVLCLGFVPAAPHGWRFGSRELDRAFQVIVLDGSEMGSGGERWIEYHPAFG